MKVCFCQGLRLQNFHFFFPTKESIYCVYFSIFMSMIWLILSFHHDKMLGILGIKLLQIILKIIFDHYDILSIITFIRLYLKYFIFWYSFHKICCRKKGKSKNKAAFGLCKSIFGKYFIFQKCYLSKRKMYLGVRLHWNSFLQKINSGVWFVQTFYEKWLPFYEKSISMSVSVKYFTKNEIFFLQKIISHVWFVNHFTENNNFKHLHYLNKPVTVQKYSSKFKHLHCLNTSVIVQKYSSTSTSKIIIWIYP